MLRQLIARDHRGGAPSGATRVAQVLAAGDGSNFDHSKALPAFDVAAGALIVVKLASMNSGSINTLTDTAGNTYLKAISYDYETQGEIWYCLSSLAKTGNVITAAFTNGNQYYGLTGEAYTGGTFALDATNTGAVQGTYTTSPLVSGTVTAAAGSLIAIAFSQYNEGLTSSTASQSPGDVINTAVCAGTATMASGEILPTSAFFGTITVDINQSPPASTKRALAYAHFTCT
jgi:hypothetical protein